MKKCLELKTLNMVYSPRKLTFNVYSSPTFSVILHVSAIEFGQLTKSNSVNFFCHLNNPHSSKSRRLVNRVYLRLNVVSTIISEEDLCITYKCGIQILDLINCFVSEVCIS